MRWILCIENKVTIFEEHKKSFILLIILTLNVKLNIFTEDVKNMLKILCDLEEMKNVMKGKKIIQVGKNIVFIKEEIKTILEEKIEEKTRKKMLMNFKIKLKISKEKKIIKN